MSYEAGPDRVQNDATTYDQEVAVLLDDLLFETSLEHVAAPLMTVLPPLGVDAVEMLDGRRQVGVRCHQDEMVVVRHEAECVTHNAGPRDARRICAVCAVSPVGRGPDKPVTDRRPEEAKRSCFGPDATTIMRCKPGRWLPRVRR